MRVAAAFAQIQPILYVPFQSQVRHIEFNGSKLAA